MSRAIGGFFPLEDAGEALDNNYINLWQINPETAGLFHNMRGALKFVLLDQKPKRVFLPAYICDSVVDTVYSTGIPIEYYPIDELLSPRLDHLKENLIAGDAVMAVDYFGRAPDSLFCEFVRERGDVLWIEDRAQALHTGVSDWGNFVLFSPRKLLGVPDGGILRGTSEMGTSPILSPLKTMDFVRPYQMRRDDRDESDNARWYSQFLKVEASMTSEALEMSELTRSILASSDHSVHSAKRLANFKVLQDSTLMERCVWPNGPEKCVPMGFPIRVKNADSVVKTLAEKRIYVPRYWNKLSCDPAQFRFETDLSAELLLLPVDHRYDSFHMKELVNEVKRLL